MWRAILLGRGFAPLLLMLVSQPASSGVLPRIALSEVVVDARGSARLDVTLNTSDDAIAGVQFDVQFDIPVSGYSVSPGSAARNAGKNAWSASPRPGVVRTLLVGLNQNAIAEGPIATLLLQLQPDVLAGRYPISLLEILAVDPDGNVVALSGSDGGVIVAGPGAAVPAVKSVLNAASYSSGGVAAGEIVYISGSSLGTEGAHTLELTPAGLAATLLGSTRVLFDGVAAPLIYAAQNQVSAVVPYAVEVLSETAVQVETVGIRSAPVAVPVLAASPGIFTLNSTGTGTGAIVNEDGTINGPANPAARGSTVLLFATGEGQTSPAGVDGRIATASDLACPLLPVVASVGGHDAKVLYAGSAPNQVAGLLQVNVRIPEEITAGPAVEVIIRVGGTSSQPGLTLAVR